MPFFKKKKKKIIDLFTKKRKRNHRLVGILGMISIMNITERYLFHDFDQNNQFSYFQTFCLTVGPP